MFCRSESAGAAVRAAATALRGGGGRARPVTGPWRAHTIRSALARARLTLDSSARYAERRVSPFFLPTVFNTLPSRGWHAAKSVAVLGGTGVSRSIRLTNGDGRLGGHWVKVTFIFGHPIITGRPPRVAWEMFWELGLWSTSLGGWQGWQVSHDREGAQVAALRGRLCRVAAARRRLAAEGHVLRCSADIHQSSWRLVEGRWCWIPQVSLSSKMPCPLIENN